MTKPKNLLDSVPFCIAVTLFCVAQVFACGQALADAVDDGVAELERDWAKAYYHVPENRQEATFRELVAKAHQFTVSNPGRAEPMVWEAIILCSHAKFSGGLGALDKVTAARDELERAEKIEPRTLSLSVATSLYTTLASLYYKVPPWPIGFGNNKKAREYLDKAIKINPDGIDPNYYYGDFLLEQGEYREAKTYLEKVLKTPPSLGEGDADKERRAEARMALEKVKQHLSSNMVQAIKR